MNTRTVVGQAQRLSLLFSELATGRKPGLLGLLLWLAPLALPAQTYSIDWHKVAGGGGTSTNGPYALTGTIGQPDAGVMSAGNYTLEGGFWNTVAAVQTPGAPLLSVARSNTAVVVSWPKADPDWKLVYTTSFVATGTNAWTLVPPPYPTNLADFILIEPVPAGNKFYRLRKP